LSKVTKIIIKLIGNDNNNKNSNINKKIHK